MASRISEGDTILIESGSVNALLARELAQSPQDSPSLPQMSTLPGSSEAIPCANIILLGGLYQQESETLVGQITKNCIDQLSIDKAFIGIDGYHFRKRVYGQGSAQGRDFRTHYPKGP